MSLLAVSVVCAPAPLAAGQRIVASRFPSSLLLLSRLQAASISQLTASFCRRRPHYHSGCRCRCTIAKLGNSLHGFDSNNFGVALAGIEQFFRSQSTMSLDSFLIQHQDPEVIDNLYAALSKGRYNKGKTKFKCRASNYTVNNTDMKVTSWKMMDHDYKLRTDLPTYARGLFTYHNSATDHHEIVIRGYDKFFNIKEVGKTKWTWIENNTMPPYDLTLKENGCIIFISGLPGGNLLVTSKHATGQRKDGEQELSHAKVGENWIERQLAVLGKTKKEFAYFLRDNNLTAVAELCDDSFEEHILEYVGNRAGLYIHGVNLNLPTFTTFPMAQVKKFAKAWGFKMIDYLTVNTVPEMRAFLEESAKTGSWGEHPTEGFVVRCKARHQASDPDCHDWFFKYKFDQPYLMYRQWREITKMLIANKQPNIKGKHQKITSEYLEFARTYFEKYPEKKNDYLHNHGIIALRNAFLASKGLNNQEVKAQQEKEEALKTYAQIVLVPIATIGVGKTTVALALKELFKWEHYQNDSVKQKAKKPQAFAKACSAALINYPAVVADRNNHMRKEREQLMNDIEATVSGATFVALHWVHKDGLDVNLIDKVKRKTLERVLARGDNHQTIHAVRDGGDKVKGIMEGFLSRFQPCDPDSAPDERFDYVIDLDPLADSRKNLETIVRKLHQRYPLLVPTMPSAKAMDKAISNACAHIVDVSEHHDIREKAPKGPQNNKAIEYFALTVPCSPVIEAIERAFASESGKVKAAFWNQLKASGRVQKKFHVTLMHKVSAKDHCSEWNKYSDVLKEWPKTTDKAKEDSVQPTQPGILKFGEAGIKLESLVWDNRVITIVASIDDTAALVSGEGKMKLFCANEVAHITVGTATQDIRPKESNIILVHKWQGGKGTSKGDVQEILLNDGKGIRVRGELVAVMQRRG